MVLVDLFSTKPKDGYRLFYSLTIQKTEPFHEQYFSNEMINSVYWWSHETIQKLHVFGQN